MRDEAVVHLDDLVLRRTELGEDPRTARELAPRLAGWFDNRTRRRRTPHGGDRAARERARQRPGNLSNDRATAVPNTLGHIAVQVVASRALFHALDLRWALLGCVIPDLPWVANRALSVMVPGLDALAVRPYWIAQSSLAGCLLLCAAFAALARAPGRVFALLSSNALLHLLLDAVQTKFGNGVQLFAPFSWYTWNAGWFWPESPVTMALTLLGAGIAVATGFVVYREARPVAWPRPRACWLAMAFLAGYLALPLAVRDAIVAADVHSLDTLANPELRRGREAAFDRVWLDVDPASGAGRLHVMGGIVLDASGALAARSSSVSARGTFVDAHHIELAAVHRHGSFPRAWASYLGLAAIAVAFAVGEVGARRAAQAEAAASSTASVSRTQRSQE